MRDSLLKNRSTLIVLDGDGVIFDYREAFAHVWHRAFGEKLTMVEPNAYHATRAYGVEFQDEAQKRMLEEHFTHDAWATMPLMPGAKEACERLAQSGYTLVIVSSMNPEYARARVENCEQYQLPISAVHAVKRTPADTNPKLTLLNTLEPAAFVDDLVSNFEGVDERVHRAFINYQRIDCPSAGSAVRYHTEHKGLLEFAAYWLSL